MDSQTPETISEDIFQTPESNQEEAPPYESQNYTALPDIPSEEQRQAYLDMLKSPPVKPVISDREQYLADIDADADKYEAQENQIPHKSKSLKEKVRDWFNWIKKLFQKKESIPPQ